MKRLLICLLIASLLLPCLGALGENWYCPKCGRLNDDNFCPSDGTPRPVSGGGLYGYNYASVTATLNRKLATRTGPGTQYDEPGTFLGKGYQVTALSKAYDAINEIWWIQVEFSAEGQRFRAYTGAQRFDGLNLALLPAEAPLGDCYISIPMTGYYGPSYDYKPIARSIPTGVGCDIYGRESGPNGDFIQIEFYDAGVGQNRRAWVRDDLVDHLNMYDETY